MIKNKNLTLAVILLYPFMKLITEKFLSSPRAGLISLPLRVSYNSCLMITQFFCKIHIYETSLVNGINQLYNLSILGFLKVNTGMTTIVRIFLSCYF